MAIRLLLLIACCTILNAAFAAKAPKPTHEVDFKSCVTAECHGEVKNYAFMHGPVASDECAACHTLTNAETHKFELWRQKEELCTYCHKFDTGMLPVIHSPVLTGECIGCHNPHGGTDRALAREATMAETCGRCHDSVVRGMDFLHDPVEKGTCTACHRPHASRYPMLLDAVGTELCLTCHDDFAGQMQNVAFQHKAMEKGCTACHDVHGSNHPKAVTKSISELCLGCHEDVEANTLAAYKHPSVTNERSCLTCHTSHGSDLASLMRDTPLHVCMECHDKKHEKNAPEQITAMVRMNDPTRFQHTPVREGQCGGCHTIHGGELPDLLHKEYSVEFRQHFSAEDFQLCFECHDQRLVTDESTFTATNFRNGGINLHYVHVAADKSISRNCRVCHGVHTSTFPSLVRNVVPYGNWPMAIRFDKTMTGGNCTTGCHAEFAYDRDAAVESNYLAEQTNPTPIVPIANRHEPVIARFSALDIYNNPVTIPAPTPSVVVLLRDGHAQTEHVLKLLAPLQPGAEQHVVVIYCGENAERAAAEFAATSTQNWPVIPDPHYELSATLGVQVWPATLVVQNDGAVLSHVGGAPPSLTKQVQAYLEFASARITQDTLKRRLAQHELLADGPEKRAAWHLQMGRKLLGERKFAEARTTLADGLKLQPNSIELQVEMVRALVELKETTQASGMLQKIPTDAVPGWERDLLNARVMASMGRWDEVKRHVNEVLTQMPDLGEARYLMGVAYENERDWEKAAEAYRAAYTSGVR